MMNEKLFTPFRFSRSGTASANRIALAPMTNMQSHHDGTLSDDEYKWLVRRAREGFGVVITCAANVSADGQGWQGELGIYDDKHIPGLSRLAKGITDEGGVGVVQIFHGGARAPQSVTGVQPWSASAHVMPHAKEPVAVREATKEDIGRVIQDFVQAAARAARAGFQGVELHGAHGYLLHQFLSTVTNQRTDEWGGSFEHRSRLLRTILKEIRQSLPSGFLVGVRISPEDKFTFQGIDFDESLALARILTEEGADYIHISPWEALKKPEKYPDSDRNIIQYFRDAAPDAVIMVAGNIWGRSDAEEALRSGADFVAIGKAAIGHANWPEVVRNSNEEPSKPPYTEAHLRAQDLGTAFIDYMKRWKDFVAG